MDAERVAEWKQRKASRAPDPLAALAALAAGGGADGGASASNAPLSSSAAGCFVAKVGETVVARSSNVQHANRRVYFPAADCVTAAFVPSSKRWR